MKIKNYLPYLITAAALIFLILLLEMLSRAISPSCKASFYNTNSPNLYTSNPIVGILTKPNLTGYANSYLESNFFVKTNSLGFRDEEIEPIKTKKRIVVLGDSMLWGWAVDQPDLLTEVLEHRLMNNTEVINLGGIGTGTTQQLMYFKEFAQKHEFDTVIVAFFVGNDFEDNIRVPRYMPNYVLDDSGDLELAPATLIFSESKNFSNNNPFYISLHMFLFDNSCFYQSIYPSLSALLVSKKMISFLPVWRNGSLCFQAGIYSTGSDLYEKSIPITKKALEEFKKLSSFRDKNFYVLLLPTREQVQDTDWKNIIKICDLRESQIDRDYPVKNVLKICEELNLTCLDLLPAFREKYAQGKIIYSNLDIHLNKEGHALIAEQIANLILNSTEK